MAKTRTFIDSGVLIAAATGTDEVASRAMAVLDDPERTFVTSGFVRLEVLPKAKYHQRVDEAAFYDEFFDAVDEMVTSSAELVNTAQAEAELSGLPAMDALHVTAVAMADCDVLVTAEKPTRTIFRTNAIEIETIRPDDTDRGQSGGNGR